MRESLSEYGQRRLDVHKLLFDHRLATIRRDLERIALRCDREEVDVGEACGHGARVSGV